MSDKRILQKDRTIPWKMRLYDLSSVLILVFILLLFTILNLFRGYAYLTPENISTIVNQASFLALLGAAQMVVLLTGGVNLSIGATMVFACIACGNVLLQKSGASVLLPVMGVLLFGALSGVANGLLITKFKLPAFIATFSTMYIFRGLSWIIQGRTVLYGVNEKLRFLALGKLCNIGGFVISMPMVVMLLTVAVLSFVLKRTILGKQIYFTGSNQEAARFSGIPINRIVMMIHILSGVLAGFCGLMYAARVNAADPTMYTSAHFDAISVALIGGISMRGGYGNVSGVIVGALIIATIQSGMNSVQVPSEYQALISGLLIIFSVFFNLILLKARQNPKQDAGSAPMVAR